MGKAGLVYISDCLIGQTTFEAMTQRILVGKDGVIINILEHMADDHPFLMRRRDQQTAGFHYFIDTSTGLTAQIGDPYDVLDLQIEELRINEPIVWRILHLLYNHAIDPSSPPPTEDAFAAYLKSQL